MNDLAPPPAFPARDRPGPSYEALLNSVADGVLSISPDRRIEVLNATGAAILGREPDAIVGRTLIEAFLLEESNDAFLDAVLAAVEGNGRTTRTVVEFRRGEQLRHLAVASTVHRGAPGRDPGQGTRAGVVATFSDVSEVVQLRGAEETLQKELAAEHTKLQDAYLRLEEATLREGRVARRTRLVRVAALVAVVGFFAALGAYNWGTIRGLAEGAPVPAEGGDSDTLTVSPRPVTSRVAVVGAVDAGTVVSVVGPFDGTVQSRSFEYGGPVERGQVLLTVDVADTQVRLRDAQGAEIKARQQLDELRSWETGAEVSRARRTLTTAELENGSLRTRLAQTRMLLGKGIVAADEYTQLLQQQRSLDLQIQAARQDLQAALERGSEENRRVAEFALLNAQAKVQELRGDLGRATVLAPVSGVVLQPVEAENKRAELIAVGSRVTRGQTMFTIGDLESFSIRVKVDEIDINKVRVGQRALVSGDAFDDMSLEGKVTSVAAQASGESATKAGMATFPVSVQITDLTPEQRARIHVGMSASVTVIAYDNPEAIVVPPGAVGEQDGKRVVRVRGERGVETVPVTLGITTPDGVEVRRGLKPGDVVQLAP